MSARRALGLALLSLSVASAAHAQPGATAPATAAAPQLVVAAPVPPPSYPDALVLPKDTPVRLMVLNEVNTRKAKVGDKFVLRVDENVAAGGTTIIPVGAKAFGEVTMIRENGALGRSGKIGARLLYIEVGEARIPISGEEQTKGNAGGDRVVMAAAAFGPFGLLARGTQGKLKAGAIFNGYLESETLFDPRTSSFITREAEPSSSEPPS